MEKLEISKTSYKKALIKSKEVLESGGLIISPTETVYGLAALANDEKAVRKIFELKNRPLTKPLPLLAGNIGDFEGWAVLDDEAIALAKKFWPGPLTMVVKRGEKTSDIVTAGKPNIAVRIPGHYFVLELLNQINGPVVATSANLSGETEPARLEDVPYSIKKKADLVIDGGPSLYEAPSTVIDLTKPQKPILRSGPIVGSEIMDVLKSRF